jgi:hypothetical protein
MAMNLPGSARAGLSQIAKLAIWVLASALLMVIGALGPWARIFGVVSVSGTDGNGGVVVLVAGLVVAGMTLLRLYKTSQGWVIVVGVIAAAIAVLASIVNLVDIKRTVSGNSLFRATDVLSTGWGLWLDSIASISALIGLFVFGIRAARQASPPSQD